MLCLELGIRLVVPGGHLIATAWNRSNPEMTVSLPAGIYARLSRSVKHNLEAQFLLRADPDYLFRVSPSAGGRNPGCHTGLNAEGFRDAEDFAVKRRQGRIIALVGDSCFFGLGVCRVEDTLAPALERTLARRGILATVYNLAQPGFSTEQAARLLRAWLPALRPDFVVVGTGWNDLFPSAISDREVLAELSWGSSRLLTLLRGLSGAEPAPPATRRVPASETSENLSSIESLSVSAGATVVWFPLLRAPSAVEWLPDPASYNEALAGRLGPVAPPRLEQRHFREDGFHPNREGIALEAEWIAERILHALR